jgi:hypothetical protein
MNTRHRRLPGGAPAFLRLGFVAEPLEPDKERIRRALLAECVRLSRLAQAAQSRLAGSGVAIEVLADLMEARWVLEVTCRSWLSSGASSSGEPGQRVARRLDSARQVRLRAVDRLHELRPLEPLERFDCDAAAFVLRRTAFLGKDGGASSRTAQGDQSPQNRPAVP